MQNQLFDQIKINAPRKNKFDLSHEKKLSFNMGELIPIMVQEIVPGDSFKVQSEVLLRLAPMLAPVMHRVDVFTHYFFVPNRLIWSEWEDFITGGPDGTLAPVPPTAAWPNATDATLFADGSLSDYLGIPTWAVTAGTPGTNVGVLAHRAYMEIYNEYYRDQTLTPEVAYSKASGAISTAEMQKLVTKKRAWEKDYFTSALPFAQRGAPVNLPTTVNYLPTSTIKTTAGVNVNINSFLGGNLGGVGGLVVNKVTTPVTGDGNSGRIENIQSIVTTINDLRKAERLQQWLEKSARAGSRYVEQIKAFFGVTSSDARLQRPEYLGGGKSPVVISEVLSTVATTAPAVPQGNMAGHGVSVGATNGFSRTFEEHGFVMGIMSVLPRSGYTQGLPRMFSRPDRFAHYWPEFANIGEQEVLAKEIYTEVATPANNEVTFGYQSRYAEYKFGQNTVHGDFRNSLSYWHMCRLFGSRPFLNTSFIESDPTHRIFAVTDPAIDKLYCQVFNNVSALRPMPYFGTPSL